MALPQAQGLYDPSFEHDACGVGFVAHIKNRKSHGIVAQGLKILENLTHRGATGYDPLLGDGAGILIQLPDAFLRAEACHEVQGFHFSRPLRAAEFAAFMAARPGAGRMAPDSGQRE